MQNDKERTQDAIIRFLTEAGVDFSQFDLEFNFIDAETGQPSKIKVRVARKEYGRLPFGNAFLLLNPPSLEQEFPISMPAEFIAGTLYVYVTRFL